MTHKEFCIWLQGYFEILGAAPDDVVGNLCEQRTKIIKEKLDTVLNPASAFEQALKQGKP